MENEKPIIIEVDVPSDYLFKDWSSFGLSQVDREASAARFEKIGTAIIRSIYGKAREVHIEWRFRPMNRDSVWIYDGEYPSSEPLTEWCEGDINAMYESQTWVVEKPGSQKLPPPVKVTQAA